MQKRPPRHTRRQALLLAVSIVLMGGLQLAGVLAEPQEPGRSNPNRHREYPDTPLTRRLRALDPNAFEFRRAHRPLLEGVRTARRSIARGLMTPAEAGAAAGATAVAGTFRYPVIVGRFAPPNDFSNFDLAELAERLFGTGYTGDSHTGSMRDYYDAISFGRISMQGDVYGYADVDSVADHYRDHSGDSVGDHLVDWIEEVVAAIDDTVDFSQYDSNHDGIVDVLILVHNLKGYECTGTNHIGKGYWSHRWSYSAASYWLRGENVYLLTDDDVPNGEGKVRIDDYVIQPLQQCSGGMVDVGVFTHEMGHAFGLPDLYDTDGEGSGGEGEGIGHWGLMSSGNWNRTYSPAAMSAWSRYELGWYENLIELDSTDAVGLLLPDIYRSGTLVRLHSAAMAPGEYFLVENRQAHGFDSYLHGTGLLVYHINEGVATANRNPLDLRWGLEQADGRFDLEANANRGDGGDPWPGSAGAAHFWAGSTPASLTRSGEDSFVEIRLHTPSADTMALDIFTTPSFLLTTPLDAELVTEARPQLEWNSYSAPAGWGSVRYSVEVDTSTAFTTAERDTVTGTSLTWAADLAEGELWYWRVHAFDPGGQSRVNSGGPGSFTIDATAPDLTLGALRNPVLGDHLDLILVGNEPLASWTMTSDLTPLEATPIAHTSGTIVRADIELAPGTHSIHATAADAAGNTASAEAVLTVVGARAGHPFSLISRDGRFAVTAGSGAVFRDVMGSLLEDGNRYTLEIPERVQSRTLTVTMNWADRPLSAGEVPVIWRRSEGAWEALPTAVDFSAGTAVARVYEEGVFELRFRDEGMSRPPSAMALEPPWPNPFNPSTRLAFQLPAGSEVRLTIVDVRGRTIRVLADGYRPAGRHLVSWNGTDSSGHQVASGIYLAVLETRSGRLTRKLTLLR